MNQLAILADAELNRQIQDLQDSLRPEALRLDQRAARMRMVGFGIIAAAGLGFAISVLMDIPPYLPLVILFAGLLINILPGLVTNFFMRRFEKKVIREVSERFPQQRGSLGYGDLLTKFLKHGLLSKDDKNAPGGSVNGSYSGTDFEIAPISVQEKDSWTRPQPSALQRLPQLKFDGHMTCLRGDFSFQYKTIVMTDQGFLANMLGKPEGLQRVALEDPVFEQHFEVFGDDQIGCRTLLTPGMMDQLTGLRQLNGAPMAFGFHRNELMILAARGNLAANQARHISGVSPIVKKHEAEALIDRHISEACLGPALASALTLEQLHRR